MSKDTTNIKMSFTAEELQKILDDNNIDDTVEETPVIQKVTVSWYTDEINYVVSNKDNHYLVTFSTRAKYAVRVEEKLKDYNTVQVVPADERELRKVASKGGKYTYAYEWKTHLPLSFTPLNIENLYLNEPDEDYGDGDILPMLVKYKGKVYMFQGRVSSWDSTTLITGADGFPVVQEVVIVQKEHTVYE